MLLSRPFGRLREIKLVSEVPDLTRGLLRSRVFARLPVAIDSTVAYEEARKQSPPDGVEIVDWMLASAADLSVLDAWAEEYSRIIHSPQPKIVFGAGDPWAPGVRTEELYAPSERGANVRSRGYAIVKSPYGDLKCPAPGKATFAIKDLLAWACVPWIAKHQWRIALSQWKELARLPVNTRVRFASIQGYVAPNFFRTDFKFPSPMQTLVIDITSDKQQTLTIRGRGLPGSFETVYFEDQIDLDVGQNRVFYVVTGFPFVANFTLELQPQDKTQTVLDRIKAIPG